MNRLLQNRLLLQLLFTFAAALCVATLSVVLITDAVRGAERVVLSEAHRTLTTAIAELREQYRYRVSSDSSWSDLPAPARDISLRGITETVLRSYPGVEGGFYTDGSFLGYGFPTHDTGTQKTDVPSAERGLIVSVARQSLSAHHQIQQVIRGRSDLLVIGAVPSSKDNTVAWAMKRLVGRGAPGAGRRELLLAILVVAALASIAGTLATGLSLARGVAQIKNGLATLEQDFAFRLPERSDELGGISRSVNRMATTRRKLEQELRREDRLRALGRLTAALAHEIRNPLNSIRLTVQLLEHKLTSNTIRAADLQVVRAEVDRLNNLLNDLLDLQRSRHPQPKEQAVLPVLEHCVGLVERQAGMQNTGIRLEECTPALTAFFDSQQLTQTVVNLLLNALEASPAGGTVQVRVCRENGMTRVEVEDEGPGLDPEKQEHLFEAFYTTKPAGTGLGLAVSRELMRSQGGDLLYASNGTPDGTGARFIIKLPNQQ
jgi:signal transduction histidine kinase